MNCYLFRFAKVTFAWVEVMGNPFKNHLGKMNHGRKDTFYSKI